MNETKDNLPDRDFWSPNEVAKYFGEDAVKLLNASGIGPGLQQVFSRDQIATLTPRKVPATETTERIVVDHTTFSVSFRDQQLSLGNSTSFNLLAYLATNPNRCFTYGWLAFTVWKNNEMAEGSVNKATVRLRRKLKEANFQGVNLITAYGGVKLLIDPPPTYPASAQMPV